jgi:hypothetical protein
MNVFVDEDFLMVPLIKFQWAPKQAGHNACASDSKESGEGGIRTPGTGFARATA